MSKSVFRVTTACLFLVGFLADNAFSQVPVESEVRQIVTFSFLPGKFGDALTIYRDQAVQLYKSNPAMLSVRGFREVESPIPLDLIVVSAFKSMAGMDESNSTLRTIATDAGTSIGAIYGGIASFSSGHTDQFVEMLPALGAGDPSSRRLTAFIWYDILPGQSESFEEILESTTVPWEKKSGIPSATGRFLVSDGWNYLRLVGFDSLGDYQEYWSLLNEVAGHSQIAGLTVRRREVIVASVSSLSVR